MQTIADYTTGVLPDTVGIEPEILYSCILMHTEVRSPLSMVYSVSVIYDMHIDSTFVIFGND